MEHDYALKKDQKKLEKFFDTQIDRNFATSRTLSDTLKTMQDKIKGMDILLKTKASVEMTELVRKDIKSDFSKFCSIDEFTTLHDQLVPLMQQHQVNMTQMASEHE